MKRASIYRFGNCVAVSMNGSVGYLQQKEAQAMAMAINVVVTNIALNKPGQNIGTFTVEYAETSGEAAALSEASTEITLTGSALLKATDKGWDMVEGDDT